MGVGTAGDPWVRAQVNRLRSELATSAVAARDAASASVRKQKYEVIDHADTGAVTRSLDEYEALRGLKRLPAQDRQALAQAQSPNYASATHGARPAPESDVRDGIHASTAAVRPFANTHAIHKMRKSDGGVLAGRKVNGDDMLDIMQKYGPKAAK